MPRDILGNNIIAGEFALWIKSNGFIPVRYNGLIFRSVSLHANRLTTIYPRNDSQFVKVPRADLITMFSQNTFPERLFTKSISQVQKYEKSRLFWEGPLDAGPFNLRQGVMPTPNEVLTARLNSINEQLPQGYPVSTGPMHTNHSRSDNLQTINYTNLDNIPTTIKAITSKKITKLREPLFDICDD